MFTEAITHITVVIGLDKRGYQVNVPYFSTKKCCGLY